jgi:hypothetical protein
MPLTDDLLDLLDALNRHGPVMTKSNIARTYADAVAEAASRGFITTLIDDEATREWRLTPRGLAARTMK